ncbi:MAG: M23 family metallopeptidase [Patescibacteria group bacterium]|nr:M23 family metallopeptidase [Patescibacteria group bacterium]
MDKIKYWSNSPVGEQVFRKIHCLTAWWGVLILAVIIGNFALNKGDLAFSSPQNTLGGPSEEYQRLRQDSLLATAAMAQEIPEEPAQNILSDSLNPANSPISQKSKKKPSQFRISPPTIGWNWGQLHAFNAVDIANRCGTPIYAAREGIIIEAVNDDSWNNGYGNSITIEHPNSIETLYAHLEKAEAQIGQYVKEKELIGYMGSTGNTYGPTGCHLHFEIHGAENPLAN